MMERASRGNVLVVDDDPVALTVAEERLRRAGYDVTVRDQALGTSQWIIANEPEFVLLDVIMPALGGSALAQIIKKSHLKTQIILHSTMSPIELVKIVRDTCALGYIAKGPSDGAFVREFEALVERGRELTKKRSALR